MQDGTAGDQGLAKPSDPAETKREEQVLSVKKSA